MKRKEIGFLQYIEMATIPLIFRLILILIILKFTIKAFGIILGILSGIILLYILLQIYIIIMKKLFNLEFVNGIEKIYITRNPKNGFHIVSCINFSNYNEEEIYNFIYEYYICKIKRFRQKLTQKYFEFWFKEISKEEAKKSIIKLGHSFKTEEEIMEHIQKEMNEEIDIFNELPYKFQIAPIGKEEEKKGILIFKFEHIMTDGLGLISALCTGAENYSIDSFPSIMKNVKDDTLNETIFYWLVYPFTLIHSFFVFLPMKCYKSPLIPKNFSGKNIIFKSKSYKLKDFEKLRKENKISFNDLMVSVLSKSMYKLINLPEFENYKNKKRMRIFLPVARKKLARNTEEIDIVNKTNLVICDVSLIKDFTKKNLQNLHNDIRKYFKRYIQFAYIKTTITLGTICSWPIFEIASQALCNRFELAFTNVPGPKIKLNYGNNVIENLIFYITPSRGLSFLSLISYNEKFHLTLTVDGNCDVKPDLYIKLIENELDELSNEASNIKTESENEDSSKFLYNNI